MEYVEGGSLQNLLIKRKTFNEDETRFIMAELILGLEYLHNELTVMHRDLKPSNILISKNGHIKIADFGLSKEFSTSQMATS